MIWALLVAAICGFLYFSLVAYLNCEYKADIENAKKAQREFYERNKSRLRHPVNTDHGSAYPSDAHYQNYRARQDLATGVDAVEDNVLSSIAKKLLGEK